MPGIKFQLNLPRAPEGEEGGDRRECPAAQMLPSEQARAGYRLPIIFARKASSIELSAERIKIRN
jgi:hypothetical protein